MARDGGNVTSGTGPSLTPRPSSLTELLRGRAGDRPERPVFSYSPDGTDGGGPVLTLGELDTRARAIAAWLQSRDLAGERVLLVFPPGLEFVTAFFGCLYAGSAAVPVAVPRPNRPMDRLRSVVDDARPAALLTSTGMITAARHWLAQVPALGAMQWGATEAVPDALARLWRDPGAGPDGLAFLQYTSGSTAAPKGVMVTHGNLLHNSALINQSFRATDESRGVFWLPLFHDMGLIGGVVQTLYCGGFSTLMSPVSFLQRPVRWLEAVARTGATISGGPNFAYDLCARKVTAEQKAGLDLSRWAVAFNGAEPIRAATLDRFAEAFAPCGFRREAFLPCYGLAESTLMVTGKRAESAPRSVVLRAADLDSHRVVESEPGATGTRVLVGSGEPFEGLRVVVVDPTEETALPEGRVGEIWVRGASVAAGYWGRPDETSRTFGARLRDGDGPFLRTGDLGFIRDGELYVTGRRKDLLIVRGRNVYPQDVEWTAAGAHPLARPEGAAAFAVEVDGEERLVVALEVERPGKGFRADEVIAAVRGAVADQHDIDAYAVCLVKPSTLSKTSSGKVQRHACREAFLRGTLDEVARSVLGPGARPDETPEPRARAATEIESWLVGRLASMLGVVPDRVDVRRPLASYGLGSLQAVGLAGELEQWLGRTLSPTLVYEYPTLEGLARHLAGATGSESGTVRAGGTEEPEPGTVPIALIGIGCRLPGADGPDAFWRLLSEGTDAVGSPPSGRRVPPSAGAERAGFLDRVDLFDAAFFGISPREAVYTDPQQRLLLEVAWEALEDAGLAAERLSGSNVGVFLGVSTNDYARRVARLEPREAYALTGNALGVAANRISYTFDFRGPSLVVDTACSSSLVALHLACESLRRGESSVALAGGVNLVLDGAVTETFSASGFLAADGRCKAFDAAADGYVRGEGAGVVVLKPLERAVADGDPIYAVVRGSAVNQDGRSNGMTAPNREAQESVLRAAYRRAGVAPASVDYIEAHGTGTLLGDPIEASALAAVVGPGRPSDRPCLLGSVKTNVGHLEAAAGVAGVIKVALALHRGAIPPSLHFERPNQHIAFDALPIRVTTGLTPWPAVSGDRARVAGVSSFGFGGTNAHAVLESPPRCVGGPERRAEERPHLIAVSARTPDALRALARAYRDRLRGPDAPAPADVSHTSLSRRSHQEYRVSVVARTGAEAAEQLDSFLRGEAVAGLAAGRRSPSRRPRCVFVYSGQGGQWRGMARDLIDEEPAFRAALRECDGVLRPLLGWSVIDELRGDGGRFEETGFAQPLGFALQVALTALWRSWGIEPDAVVGHSVGEVAAAHVAGALDLGSAARVVALRARSMQTTTGAGLAAAVALPAAEVAALVADDPGRLAVACDNGPAGSVFSGDAGAVAALAGRLRDRGVAVTILPGRCAFHSPQMEPLRDDLRAGLAGLTAAPARVPIVSTVTGRAVAGNELGPDYWARNLRETVHFADAVEALVADPDGLDAFLEIGPHPSLGPALRELLSARGRAATVQGSLRKGVEGRTSMLESLAGLYALGKDVEWHAVAPAGRYCRLPGYAFQREPFWLGGDGANGKAPGPVPTVRHDRLNGYDHALANGSRNGTKDGPSPDDPPRNGHSQRVTTEDPGANGRHPPDWYEVDWRPTGRVESAAGSLRAVEVWVIVEDAGGVAPALTRALEASGARCVRVAGSEAVGPGGAAALKARLGEASALGPLAGVIHLAYLDAAPAERFTAADLDAARSSGGESLLALSKALADWSGPGAPRLWVVTAGAQPVGGGVVRGVLQAAAWGLGRSFALARPDLWGGLVDLDADDPVGSVPALAAETLGPAGEDQIAYRGGVRHVARLVPRRRLAGLDATLPVGPEGTYLVTGGLGDLGLRVAGRMVEQGARRLVLVGRRGLPDRGVWDTLPPVHPAARAIGSVREMERRGATIYAAAVDVADRDAMTALFVDLRRMFPPLRGVVHAAGTVGAGTDATTPVDSLAAAFRPKVAGTWVLHGLTRDLPLDFFVTFSSVAALFGAKEAAYAAANHVLDAFAHFRRSQGLPALSVNWGPWEGPGMAGAAGRRHAFDLLGVTPLRVNDGLDSLAGLLAAGATQAAVVEADWEALRSLFGSAGRPLLDALAPAPIRRGAGRVRSRGRTRLVDELRNRLAAVLKTEPERVDLDRPIDAMGLDSLMAIELKNAIESDLGVSLPLASLLRGPTVEQLAGLLSEGLTARAAVPLTATENPWECAAEGDWPLSVGQRALWSLHQIEPASSAYNVAGAAWVAAPVDAAALRRSVQRLVNRHPALRTTFPLSGTNPVQRVLPRAEVAFRFEDASGLGRDVVRRRVEDEANRPFDLENGPLYRVHVFRLGEADHALLLAVHHAVSDFWSVAVLLDELGRIYPAEVAGREPDLPPPPVPFTEFVGREAAYLASPDGERDWEHWRVRLAGPLPVLALPTDRPRPALQSYRGAAAHLSLDPALAPRLAALGRRHAASLYLTLLAAFQVLMARLSGQDDVIVGSPVAGRDRPDAADVVGYFVNTLPLRARVDAAVSFDDFLERVRADVLDDLEHQALPFGVIAERVQAARDPGRSPVFQVLFVLQKAQRLGELGLSSFTLRGSGPRMELGGLPMESIPIESRGAQFDLVFNVVVDSGRLAVSAEYNTDLFDPATVDRFLDHFRVLLEAVAADASRPIGDLPLLSQAGRDELALWNATGIVFPADETVVGLFESQAARTPDAVAVTAADGSLTYGELAARADRLARRLRAAGVGPEARVAVLASRSCATLVGILGALKAGGAYVPLDPEYPAARLAFMLDDCRPVALLARQADAGVVPRDAVPVIDPDEPSDDEASAAVPAVEDAHPAYVIYTSGSTGTPKGVVVTHRNLASSTRARFHYYREPVGRYLLVSSFAFDSSVAGIFWTLGQGGTLVLPGPGETTDPLALGALIRRERVTHWLGVPSLYGLILDHAPSADLASVRTVIVAGEPCPPGLPARHAGTLPEARLYNEYGPTEATVWATVHCCTPDDGARGSVPIGRPIANTRAHVLDPALSEVPVGVTGELYLGGAGVARGYLDRPGLTAERFVADPFSAEPGARLYRTGDLARRRTDGSLECLGRVDGQVKVRGHRVELGEVESALASHPAVREAAAAARPGRDGETRLVGYLVARTGETIEAGPLRTWLRTRLPDAMVPSVLTLLDDLPRSPNGKVDRAALPDPVESRLAPTPDGAPPRDATEATLAGLAADLLGVPRVGVHDDVFELGFDSILAIQLAARARAVGIDVMPAQVFQHPSVALLAAGARPATAPAPAMPAPVGFDGPEVRVEDLYPLTPLQQGMLLHARYAPGSGAYVQQIDCAVRGEPDLASLRRAWDRLTGRHAVLRTGFRWSDDGSPQQVVHRSARIPWKVVDWRGLTPGERERRLDAFLADDRARGFDPAEPPLSRVTLVRFSEGVNRLVWTYHHLLVDGWCLQILLGELLALYEEESTGRPAGLPAPPPFRSYIDWISGHDPARSEPFWREVLRGFRTPTPLGVDRPATDERSDETADTYEEQEAYLPAATTAELGRVSRRHGLTLATVVQGAWAVLLSRYGGSNDVVFGVTVSGRSAPVDGVESMVGPLINTIPVRARFAGGERVFDWLARFQEGLIEARRHESTPLALVRGWSEVPPGLPLFETLLVFENYPVDVSLGDRAGGLGLGPARVIERTEYPLTVMAFPGPSLLLRITYDGRRFDAATVDRLLGHLTSLLEGVAADPGLTIDELSLATADEVRRLLDQWNDSPADPVAARPGGPEPAPARGPTGPEPDLDRLSDEEVEALIGEYLQTEEASDE